MVYLNVKPVSPNKWNFTAPIKSTKTIATVTRRNGQCSVITKRPITRAELSAIWSFVDMEQSKAA